MEQVNKKQETYLELISQDEKEAKVENLKIVAQRALLRLNEEKLSVKGKIAEKEADIRTFQKQIPYDYLKELVAVTELEVLNKKLTFIEKVIKERFSDATI
jgi:hypothetical protein|nr:MAG TPA: hypothetical protein [Caudoviricetes sp.]